MKLSEYIESKKDRQKLKMIYKMFNAQYMEIYKDKLLLIKLIME